MRLIYVTWLRKLAYPHLTLLTNVLHTSAVIVSPGMTTEYVLLTKLSGRPFKKFSILHYSLLTLLRRSLAICSAISRGFFSSFSARSNTSFVLFVIFSSISSNAFFSS